jgi:hypothetical protein
MQMKLLGITNVNFNVTDQQLDFPYPSYTGEKKWEYNSTVHQLFMDFKKAYDSVKR